MIAPPICAGIHRAVEALGLRFLPDDVVLKHHYDYRLVYVDPKLITGIMPINAGMAPKDGTRVGALDRYRRSRDLGGGWKGVNRHITRNWQGRFIADGDWDKEVKPFEVRPSIVQLFEEGRQPKATTEYQKLLGRVKSGDFVWTRGLRAVGDVDRYFAQLTQVFEDIRVGGYRTQTELGNDGSDEIRLCIDRNGRASVFGGGTHRLSMAVVLGIEHVPVLIKRVHALWAAECVQRYGGNVSGAIAEGIRELGRDVWSARDSKLRGMNPPSLSFTRDSLPSEHPPC